MKLAVHHTTHYEYPEPVRDSYNELRLKPTSGDRQNCLSHELQIDPPAEVTHFLDFYLNCVHFFEIPKPHTELNIISKSVVETADALPPPHEVLDFQELETLQNHEECYDFLFSSTYVSTSVSAWKLAMDIKSDCGDLWTLANAIMQKIYGDFTYDTGSTTVNTHMDEVLKLKKGVCQDFAHVMIGLCRCLKFPARYVSGYIYTGREGSELRGADASHAWCEVFLPGHGWRGFDPTNNRVIDGHYIKISVGRDYDDITPVKGSYVGGATRHLEVGVTVTRLA
jgi:transglutaminase-like putative cysteine protease